MASLSTKAMTAEIETLLSKKNAGYTECQEKKRRANELLTIKRSIGWVCKSFTLAPRPVLALVCACSSYALYEKCSHWFDGSEVDVLKFFDR